MTYAEIVAAVNAILIEPVAAATVTYIDAAMDSAQRKLEDKKVFRCVQDFELYATTDDAIGGMVSAGLYDMPDDWNGHRGNPLWQDGEAGYHEMSWLEGYYETEQIRQHSTFGTTGPPAHLMVSPGSGNTFRLFPISDENNTSVDGQYYVYVPYWKRLTPISAGGLNWFSQNCEDFLVWHTAAECFLFDQDLEKYAIWGAKADGEFRRIVKQAKREQFTGTHLKMRTDANAVSTAGRR